MKLFQFFVLENFLVVGLPQWKRICEPFFEVRFSERFRVQCLDDPLVHPSETKRQSPSEIAPPKAKEVSGIEMTEVAFHHWRDGIWIRPNLHKSNRNGDGRQDTRCQCWHGAWKNFDSNEGTGDHEELK